MRRACLVLAALLVLAVMGVGCSDGKSDAEEAMTKIRLRGGFPVSDVRADLWEASKVYTSWELEAPESGVVKGDRTLFTYGFADGSTLTFVAYERDNTLIYLHTDVGEPD